ncbi:MAG: hypothetical protein IPG91_19715 [Ideonella sp.]|nr:hypothetical protein [Ideonella sp.]
MDLAHIIVAAEQVPGVMAQMRGKSQGGDHQLTAGFNEVGAEGARLQQGLHGRGRALRHPRLRAQLPGHDQHRCRIAYYCNFTSTMPQAGGISLAALSGGVGGLILQGLADTGVGLRMYAHSTATRATCRSPRSCALLGDGDEATRAVVLYTEGFADPRGISPSRERRLAARKPVRCWR